MSPSLPGSIVWKTCGSIDRMIGGAGHGSGVGGGVRRNLESCFKIESLPKLN